VTKLTSNWKQYTISLAGLNLTNIMGGFGWTASAAEDPHGAVFYVDDIQYNLNETARNKRLNEPRFIRSYTTFPWEPGNPDSEAVGNFDYVFRNTAYTYDNSVAILAFLADGSKDSIRRARVVGDAFVYAADHDRTYTNHQIRTAYSTGDIALFPGWLANGKAGTVPISGFYDLQSQAYEEVADNLDIDTGNNAWAMIALLALYQETLDTNYLTTAQAIGQVINTFRSDTGTYQGFLGGIWNAESSSPSNRAYASTEHNLDIYAAFSRMYQITGDPAWSDGAEHAREFVEAMWDDSLGCYLAGTTGGIPNELNDMQGQLPLDTQTWSVLALTNALALHPQLLTNAEAVHHCDFDGFSGYDFNDDKDGVWFEGTGQMSVAYAFGGNLVQALTIAGTLRDAQQIPAPIGDGDGMVAASHDGVTSGFNFVYYRRLHLGATSWNIFAQLGFNPYYQTFAP
jgi:hypothetical protein